MGAKIESDGFDVGAFEQRPEPAHPLAWVVEDPELLHRSRDLERERGRPVRDRPREGGADVVLLRNCDMEALSAGTELAGVEVRTLGDGEEERGMTPMDLLRRGRLVEPLERVLADRVEHAEATAAPAPDEVLDDQ